MKILFKLTFKTGVVTSMLGLFLSSIIFEFYCFNIIVNINYFSALNILVKTTLKYCDSQDLSEKLILMGGAVIFFLKKILGREIFSSMVPCAIKYVLKNL